MKAALLLLACALPVAAQLKPAKKPEPMKTVTRKGLCSFQVKPAWRVTENWKAAAPGAVVALAPNVEIFVSFYPEGNADYPTLDAYKTQLTQPNREFEKTVSSETATQLDKRPASQLGVELLDMLWVTAKVGTKRFNRKEFVMVEYPGGFCVVGFSAPADEFEKRRGDFWAFLNGFRLLVPKAQPRLVPGTTAATESRPPAP